MKRVVGALVLLVVLAAAVLYNVRSRGSGAPPGLPTDRAEVSDGRKGAAAAIPVTVATARRRALQTTVTLTGVLGTDQQAVVSARVPARITAVLARVGQRVARGQIIVQLESRDAAAQVRSSAAGATAAEAQYRKAVDARTARRTEMDARVSEAASGVATAEAKLRQARLALRLTGSSVQSDVERTSGAVRQAEAGLRQAEAGLIQANDAVKRFQFLYSHGGATRVDLEGAQAQAETARAQRDAAAAALEQARAAADPAAASAPLRRQVSEADVDAARAGLVQAQRGLANARRARAEALRIADQDVAAARAQWEQARAGVDISRAQVGTSTLTSPIPGVVTNVAARMGETAQPGQPLVTVAGEGSMYVEAVAPARYGPMLRPGTPGQVTVDTLPDHPIDAEVSRLLPVANPDSRTVKVRLRMLDTPRGLIPGVMASVDLDLSRGRSTVSIPVDALRNEGRSTFAYVVRNRRAERRNVTLGAAEGAYVQVVSGVNVGEEVIISGPATLQSGMDVQVVGR